MRVAERLRADPLAAGTEEGLAVDSHAAEAVSTEAVASMVEAAASTAVVVATVADTGN